MMLNTKRLISCSTRRSLLIELLNHLLQLGDYAFTLVVALLLFPTHSSNIVRLCPDQFPFPYAIPVQQSRLTRRVVNFQLADYF